MKIKEQLSGEHQTAVELGLSAALDQIRHAMTTNSKPVLVLSDFDHTLCDEFVFDPLSNDHHPQLHPELIAQTRSLNLIVATGRRADNPALPQLWQSGLIPETQSVIAENGGVLLTKVNDTIQMEILAEVDSDLTPLQVINQIQNAQLTLPTNHSLVFKPGRTFLVTRVQDEHGNTPPVHQQWLAQQLRQIPALSSMQVVDTRASVTIQAQPVNKGVAFNQLLHKKGWQINDFFVVGMGDGENDAEIFAQANLRLGYSQVVKNLVDIVIPGGARSVSAVLQVINQSLGV